MAKPTPIQNLLPQAAQTLARPTQPKPEDIKRATDWLTPCWRYVGNESPEEKSALENALAQSIRWLASLLSGLDPFWLVLCGPSGVGKTLLARRLEKYLSQCASSIYLKNLGALAWDDHRRHFSYAQEGSIFVPWRDLVPHGDENQQRIKKAGRDWIKIIDDLKPQTGKDVIIDGESGIQPQRFEANAAGDLLDQRGRKWTIITSNLTRGQLALFWDVRIASRLTRDENTIIDLSAVSDYGLRSEHLRESR